MRIESLKLSPGHPKGAKTGPPGLKSSTPLRENEGFPGPGELESGPPGPDFEGFRTKAEG
jgi:hypothetical protein